MKPKKTKNLQTRYQFYLWILFVSLLSFISSFILEKRIKLDTVHQFEIRNNIPRELEIIKNPELNFSSCYPSFSNHAILSARQRSSIQNHLNSKKINEKQIKIYQSYQYNKIFIAEVYNANDFQTAQLIVKKELSNILKKLSDKIFLDRCLNFKFNHKIKNLLKKYNSSIEFTYLDLKKLIIEDLETKNLNVIKTKHELNLNKFNEKISEINNNKNLDTDNSIYENLNFFLFPYKGMNNIYTEILSTHANFIATKNFQEKLINFIEFIPIREDKRTIERKTLYGINLICFLLIGYLIFLARNKIFILFKRWS